MPFTPDTPVEDLLDFLQKQGEQAAQNHALPTDQDELNQAVELAFQKIKDRSLDEAVSDQLVDACDTLAYQGLPSAINHYMAHLKIQNWPIKDGKRTFSEIAHMAEGNDALKQKIFADLDHVMGEETHVLDDTGRLTALETKSVLQAETLKGLLLSDGVQDALVDAGLRENSLFDEYVDAGLHKALDLAQDAALAPIDLSKWVITKDFWPAWQTTMDGYVNNIMAGKGLDAMGEEFCLQTLLLPFNLLSNMVIQLDKLALDWAKKQEEIAHGTRRPKPYVPPTQPGPQPEPAPQPNPDPNPNPNPQPSPSQPYPPQPTPGGVPPFIFIQNLINLHQFVEFKQLYLNALLFSQDPALTQFAYTLRDTWKNIQGFDDLANQDPNLFRSIWNHLPQLMADPANEELKNHFMNMNAVPEEFKKLMQQRLDELAANRSPSKENETEPRTGSSGRDAGKLEGEVLEVPDLTQLAGLQNSKPLAFGEGVNRPYYNDSHELIARLEDEFPDKDERPQLVNAVIAAYLKQDEAKRKKALSELNDMVKTPEDVKVALAIAHEAEYERNYDVPRQKVVFKTEEIPDLTQLASFNGNPKGYGEGWQIDYTETELSRLQTKLYDDTEVLTPEHRKHPIFKAVQQAYAEKDKAVRKEKLKALNDMIKTPEDVKIATLIANQVENWLDGETRDVPRVKKVMKFVVTDEPAPHEPEHKREPKREEHKPEEPKTDDVNSDEVNPDEEKTEEPTTDEPKSDEVNPDEEKTEEPKTDEPKSDEVNSDEVEPEDKMPENKTEDMQAPRMVDEDFIGDEIYGRISDVERNANKIQTSPDKEEAEESKTEEPNPEMETESQNEADPVARSKDRVRTAAQQQAHEEKAPKEGVHETHNSFTDSNGMTRAFGVVVDENARSITKWHEHNGELERITVFPDAKQIIIVKKGEHQIIYFNEKQPHRMTDDGYKPMTAKEKAAYTNLFKDYSKKLEAFQSNPDKKSFISIFEAATKDQEESSWKKINAAILYDQKRKRDRG